VREEVENLGLNVFAHSAREIVSLKSTQDTAQRPALPTVQT